MNSAFTWMQNADYIKSLYLANLDNIKNKISNYSIIDINPGYGTGCSTGCCATYTSITNQDFLSFVLGDALTFTEGDPYYCIFSYDDYTLRKALNKFCPIKIQKGL